MEQYFPPTSSSPCPLYNVALVVHTAVLLSLLAYPRNARRSTSAYGKSKPRDPNTHGHAHASQTRPFKSDSVKRWSIQELRYSRPAPSHICRRCNLSGTSLHTSTAPSRSHAAHSCTRIEAASWSGATGTTTARACQESGRFGSPQGWRQALYGVFLAPAGPTRTRSYLTCERISRTARPPQILSGADLFSLVALGNSRQLIT